MNPKFDKIHLKFKLNGIHYSHEELKEVSYSLIKEGQPYERDVGNFLLDWTDSKNYVVVNTSGSTGAAKPIKLYKQAMVNSSIATGNFFGLEPGNSALHCLPAQFIAGKMMLVRAMVLGLEVDLIEPASLPVFDYEKPYDFCAMIPLQLKNTYDHIQNIKYLIVGGAKVPKSLVKAIQDIPTQIFETYGMTETITHVAIKKLNHTLGNEFFKVLPDVSITTDERDCLVIDAHHLSKQKIVTNDIVKLISENEFEWIGRYDNIINSGGVKLSPEQIEKKLADFIESRFFITSKKDDTLGEKVVLVIEDENNNIDPTAFRTLDKYEVPKEIYNVPKFKLTSNGKIKRKATLMALE